MASDVNRQILSKIVRIWCSAHVTIDIKVSSRNVCKVKELI